MKSFNLSKNVQILFLIFTGIIINVACKVDTPIQYIDRIEYIDRVEYIEKNYVEPVNITSRVKRDGSVTVSMATATEDAVIYFTTDGNIPDVNSFEYKAPVNFSEAVTISAIAVKDGLENSAVSSAVISISEKLTSDEPASYDYEIDLNDILIKQQSAINYLWKNGVKTENYNEYIYNLDLTSALKSLYGRLPENDEKLHVVWEGTIDKSISELKLQLVDANTKTAEWGQSLSKDKMVLSDIEAGKDFAIDYTFKFSLDPIEKVVLKFLYSKEVLDSKVMFKVSGLRSEFSNTFDFEASNDVIVNPHKGFVMYAWSSDYLENKYWASALASGKNPAWDYCSVVYTGCPWKYIQKDWNEFDWANIDKMLELCGNSGRTLGWRIYPTNSSQGEAGDDTPEFIYESGCGSVLATIKGTDTKIRVPDWSDPIYIKACKSFADEMARRFDGDKRVEFIDIRCFGNWGEWHCSQLEGSEMPSVELQKEMIAYYASVFKTTQLVVPSDCRGEVYEFALSLGVAKRDDGLIQIAGREDELAKCYAAGLPTIGENCDEYEKMLLLNDSDKWHRKWTLDRWKNVINVAHMTYYELDRGGKCGQVFLEDNLASVCEMNNKLGYNFEVTSASFNYDDDLNIVLSVTIKNTGLAPAFFDFNLIADITDFNGKRKFAIGEPKRIKKGSFADGEEITFVFSDLSTDILKPICTGDCICLGLYEDAESEKTNIRFDNKNTLSNNKLLLLAD